MLAVDAAHWWGPLGWGYRNLPGNLTASVVWGPIALGLGALWSRRHVIRPIHRRLDDGDAQRRQLLASHQALHDHLGTGHTVGADQSGHPPPPPFRPDHRLIGYIEAGQPKS